MGVWVTTVKYQS